MEPKGFMGYPKRCIACESNISRHEQYPFATQTKIIEPMLFAYYHKHGVGFFLGLCNTPQGCNPYVMEPNFF